MSEVVRLSRAEAYDLLSDLERMLNGGATSVCFTTSISGLEIKEDSFSWQRAGGRVEIPPPAWPGLFETGGF